MEQLIYILLSTIYLLLGIVSVLNLSFKDTALKIFIILTVLLPITKFTTTFHTHLQISFYYFYFVGVVLLFLAKLGSNRRFSLNLFLCSALLGSVLIFYIFHYTLLVEEPRKLTNVLKDIKPFILIPLGFIFMDQLGKRLKDILTKKFCVKLLWGNLAATALMYYLMVQKSIHLVLSDDPYYKYEELRYETLGSYFGIFYLTFAIFNKRKISLIELFLCLAPLLVTGNRTLIFSVLIIICLYYILRLSFAKIIAFILSAVGLLSIFGYLVMKSEEGSPLSRFKLLLDPDYIQYALLNRYSPFVSSLKSFEGWDYFIGKGLGFAFFIPWFHYRDNIDIYNIYIDNLYLTLYAKFGIFSIVFFVVMFIFLFTYNNFRTAFFYFVFILILSATNAFVYQYNFLWIFILFAFPFNTEIVKRTK
ncbi:MAG: DUF6369 family protein [Aequorivita sp.]